MSNFVDETTNGFAKLTPLERESLLGCRFIEARRRAMVEADNDPANWTSVAKGRPTRRLAEQTANTQCVSVQAQQAVIEFSSAVGTMVSNNGVGAIRLAKLARPCASSSRTSGITMR